MPHTAQPRVALDRGDIASARAAGTSEAVTSAHAALALGSAVIQAGAGFAVPAVCQAVPDVQK